MIDDHPFFKAALADALLSLRAHGVSRDNRGFIVGGRATLDASFSAFNAALAALAALDPVDHAPDPQKRILRHRRFAHAAVDRAFSKI